MPSKRIKGKHVVRFSSFGPISVLSLLHPDCVRAYETNFRGRIMVKKHTYDPVAIATLHIPKIEDLMKHQKIDQLLKVNTGYNEDLFKIIYAWLEEKDDSIFRFCMGSQSYHFNQDIWRHMFVISISSHETNLSDSSLCYNFEWTPYLNSFLKAPRTNLENLENLSTGNLKRNPRTLHWIFTYIFHPRKDDHSRIDQSEVHLMYILENKFLSVIGDHP
ncbi:unnamed protein product [Vicia faba]|uniref:Uncharacterized protein n=1 Tax=Vicia faba TaxID=3906 RepID=A0AAV1B543_VICFA|nr:unnamed protein product [Vicia faba]